ncbi:MAG: ABC transporter ATP-binding protein [Chloroflexi bacterium]|nr:ABC transporter ATP-binding protein [Chloroflexota bacterium]
MTGSEARGALIATHHLVRAFHGGGREVVAVSDVSLEVHRGEFLAFTGRSGSGKTTLLNLLGGLDRPTSGVVLFEGQALTTLSEKEMVELRRHRLGFVFQSFGLLPLLSAYENVELPLRIGGVPGHQRRQRVQEVLGQVGLEPRARHRPYELSGGEQQRVAIARAVVTSPDVVFADEPTGELDSATGLAIATLLRDIAVNRGVTVVVATHDLTLAGMADRVIELEDGHIRETADPPPGKALRRH